MQGWGKIKPAAKYAGISERTFRDWLKVGLPHSRLPSGTILIKYSDIDEFLKRFEVMKNQADEMVEQILSELS
jgi:excisionase family DNA binding protein